jgi:hypothetical protein
MDALDRGKKRKTYSGLLTMLLLKQTSRGGGV